MKTAISLPDAVFAEAERLAERQGKSRSELYRDALAEYLARHAPDAVTEAMNATVENLGEDGGAGFTARAARKILSRSKW